MSDWLELVLALDGSPEIWIAVYDGSYAANYAYSVVVLPREMDCEKKESYFEKEE